jgi:hypothetical protein
VGSLVRRTTPRGWFCFRWVYVGDLILLLSVGSAFVSSLLEAPLDQLRAEFQSTCAKIAPVQANSRYIQQNRNAHRMVTKALEPVSIQAPKSPRRQSQKQISSFRSGCNPPQDDRHLKVSNKF